MIKQVVALALLVVGMWAGATIQSWRHDDPDAALLKQYEHQVRLNDSTQVLLAAEKAEKTALKGLVTAVKQVNGKLVAGVKTKLELETAQSHDTVFVEVPTPTGDGPSSGLSARKWAFQDSAFTRKDSVMVLLGVLSGAIESETAPLGIEWKYEPQPIEPSVGFVKYANRYLAVVTCSMCKDVTVEAPFVDAKAIMPKQKRISPTVGAQYDLIGSAWTARASLDMRVVKGLSLGLEGRRILQPTATGQLLAGVAIKF